MDKSKPKQDNKEQSKRFIEKAREIEADETGEKFEKVIKRVIRRSRPSNREEHD
jgi:hypothetical protein